VSNVKKVRTAAVTGTVLAMGTAYLLAAPAAQAAAPESLSVFYAGSTATPVGIVSRVPAETAGGLVLSSSLVQLGKSQALAAGGTLGPLGDAFIVTSAPAGTISTVPSVITAQDPPSDTSPRRAELAADRGGGSMGEVRNGDLNVQASDSPDSAADASGSAVISGVISTGTSVSRSVSSVLPDGTVSTEAFTSVQHVVIGSAAAPLTIDAVASIASILIKPGAKPVSTLEVRFLGAQLAGMPVDIDANGVRFAGQAPASAAQVKQLNAAVAGLAARGVTVTAVPTSSEVSADAAKIAGSALSITYKLPDSPIPRPSDIGSDETFNIGSVSAAATSRVRQSLGAELGSPPAAAAPAAAPPASSVDSTPELAAASPPAEVPAPLLPTGDVPVGTFQAETVGFAPPRRASVAPQQFRDGYRFVLLGALAAFVGLTVVVRKRPLS
jgi:hypothetical protein